MNPSSQFMMSTTSPQKMTIHEEPSSILLIEDEKEFNTKTKVE